MPSNFDIKLFAISMCALVICITIHEFAHAYSAWRAGDDTPRHQGRISLNPFDHLDPIGTLMMIMSSISGYGIGWGKPVQTNPANYRHPRWDNLRVALWGPLSNILTAVVFGLFIRFLHPFVGRELQLFILAIVTISIGLAVFNLIPIRPLDGSHILSALLPVEMAYKYEKTMAQYGMFIFLGIIFIDRNNVILGAILGPPRTLLTRLILGF